MPAGQARACTSLHVSSKTSMRGASNMMLLGVLAWLPQCQLQGGGGAELLLLLWVVEALACHTLWRLTRTRASTHGS
jgi:hypothetical protein